VRAGDVIQVFPSGLTANTLVPGGALLVEGPAE
jgi:hypothetical protein